MTTLLQFTTEQDSNVKETTTVTSDTFMNWKRKVEKCTTIHDNNHNTHNTKNGSDNFTICEHYSQLFNTAIIWDRHTVQFFHK